MNNQNFTIITDPGIDDMLALLLLKKIKPNLNNIAISTFGNVPLEKTSKNLKDFISFASPNWACQEGAKEPIKPLEYKWPDYFHGPDGVWNTKPNVKVNIQNQKIKNFPNKIISLGPMTSVKEYMEKTKITEMIIMGGAFHVPGNETKYAETNIAFDPDAAKYCLDNCQNMEVKIIPLDVTKKVSWDKETVKKIPENNEINIWAKKMLLAWFKNYGDKKNMNFDLHDPLAIYAIFYPENLIWKTSGVSVSPNGEKRGKTCLDKNNPKCKIALDIKNSNISNKIFNILFTS